MQVWGGFNKRNKRIDLQSYKVKNKKNSNLGDPGLTEVTHGMASQRNRATQSYTGMNRRSNKNKANIHTRGHR